MAKGVLDDHKVDIACPKCGHENRKSVRWLRDNRSWFAPAASSTSISRVNNSERMAD
jgi:hypothetical protein